VACIPSTVVICRRRHGSAEWLGQGGARAEVGSRLSHGVTRTAGSCTRLGLSRARAVSAQPSLACLSHAPPRLSHEPPHVPAPLLSNFTK
jgi:hypothetical protein